MKFAIKEAAFQSRAFGEISTIAYGRFLNVRRFGTAEKISKFPKDSLKTQLSLLLGAFFLYLNNWF